MLLWEEQIYSLGYDISKRSPSLANEEVCHDIEDGKERRRGGKRKREEDSSSNITAALKRAKGENGGGVISTLLSWISFGFLSSSSSSSSYDKKKKNSIESKSSSIHDFSLSIVPRQRFLTSSPPHNTSACRGLSSPHCIVYLDLLRQGYLIGPGQLYGGNYTIYEKGKDPSSSHSIATVRVIPGKASISARDLLSFTRVQNQVRNLSWIISVDNSRPSLCTSGGQVWGAGVH